MTETNSTISRNRNTYETPRLKVFGSVRNLTGGSGSSFRDGAVQNVRF